ncbi:LOW QUALITY PROTEIN: TBC1 domain family member 25-like [Paramacrobiotus metropolitanus]|uniref:LOW QUALITY PROTEIN: TBC1 domain family member 25-like n=1 Tax=Paramacrobiotus metropolitanus TaxID=2943436 RepID=UPI002445D628|nr:LOW QUALITY PROTEIN: TBC1 domain family member 25-like [Paramacrobiotus metropolitanus]
MQSDVFSLHQMEAIKVKVTKCDGVKDPVYKKFCIDPRITSFDILRKLLAKALEIKSDFTISYQARDECNRPTYLSLLSDWDLDAALLSYADPCLRLKVDVQPFVDGFDDWDIIRPLDLPEPGSTVRPPATRGASFRERLSSLGRPMELVQKALNLTASDPDEEARSPKAPMTDPEYRNFLDSAGRLVRPMDLRRSVYLGGVDQHVRKYVWRLILNVFPDNLTGQERLDYMKRKSKEYYDLREKCQKSIRDDQLPHISISNLVKKDVLRTDRSQKFYAGSDDNKNIVALYHILTTYALTHPSVSYCQGMSDLASPLLYVMRDEAHAYICFCGLMKRMKKNFRRDSESMMIKFEHLRRLLNYYDPEFGAYLAENDSDDLLFCYRWLLVEMKREFGFEDSLRALEVIWSSLPPDPPQGEIDLAEPQIEDNVFCDCEYSNRSRFHQYGCSSKFSSGRGSAHPSKTGSENGDTERDDLSSGDSEELVLLQNSLTERMGKEFEYLGVKSKSPHCSGSHSRGSTASPSPRSLSMLSMDETLTDSKIDSLRSLSPAVTPGDIVEGLCVTDLYRNGDSSRAWPQSIMDSGITDTSSNELKNSSDLPPPDKLGDGNPFLLFVCLTILLHNRNHLLANKTQHHFELAMYFDRMIKKYNLVKILADARKMFGDYLKLQHLQQQQRAIENSSEETHSSF